MMVAQLSEPWVHLQNVNLFFIRFNVAYCISATNSNITDGVPLATALWNVVLVTDLVSN